MIEIFLGGALWKKEGDTRLMIGSVKIDGDAA